MKILFVDKDEALVEILKGVVDQVWWGAEVLYAESLREAKEILQKNAPVAIIVVTKDLPDGSGVDLIKIVGGSFTAIILTDTHESVETAAYELGATAFLQKPISLICLRALLNTIKWAREWVVKASH